MIPFIKQKFIFREDLINNPQTLYVFGDNINRVGLGGQAKEMRGEPNAVGIATKVRPGEGPEDFFHDYYTTHWEWVKADLAELERLLKTGQYHSVVLPADGLGTGLARLNETAPKLYDFLNAGLEALQCHFMKQS